MNLVHRKGLFFGMVDHKEAIQCSNIISVSLFFSEKGVPSKLSLLPENLNLNKTKLKNLINFELSFKISYFIHY